MLSTGTRSSGVSRAVLSPLIHGPSALAAVRLLRAREAGSPQAGPGQQLLSAALGGVFIGAVCSLAVVASCEVGLGRGREGDLEEM